KEIPAGSIIVAGKNFGCDSSREQAASCLKGSDVTVVAKHFARIFLQNSINLGFNTIICPDLEAEEGDELNITADKLYNLTSKKSFDLVALPKARQAIIDAGGLIPYTRQLLIEANK
ncbi:MAG: 3-isopropylmalate dehydratase, partial [Chloroflexota bacterium]